MKLAKPIVSAEIKQSSEMDVRGNVHGLPRAAEPFRPAETRDDDISANGLGTLLRRVSETSTREIENLIDELEGLRKKLQSDGTRIQRDIAEYAELSQQLMQLTSIIADSVKKLPGIPGITR
jgi:DNA repair exonuclease SbcCD ATPase subunit